MPRIARFTLSRIASELQVSTLLGIRRLFSINKRLIMKFTSNHRTQDETAEKDVIFVTSIITSDGFCSVHLPDTINDEFELINGMLEAHFVKMGKLYEFWRYDFNKADIYRASRHQLLFSPVDGSLLPIRDKMRLTD